MISKKYQELVTLVARNAVLNSERAAELTKEADPNANLEPTYKMRDKFSLLEEKISNNESLSMEDYANLWIGASITRGLLMNNINKWTAVVKEYDEDLLPKLYAIALEKDSEAREKLMTESFSAEN